MITDTITGGPNSVEGFFHLHPDVELKSKGNSVELSNGSAKIRVDFDQDLSMNIFKGSNDPMRGWYSQSFMTKVPTKTIVLSGKLKHKITTRISLL